MKTIKDYDLKGKKVIIRVDFNVPIKDGIITDDNRIKESLKTINYALDNDAKIILLSHLGRVKEAKDLNNTLKPVADRLGELLNKNIKFIPKTRGIEVENTIKNMENKDIVLLENTRFEDYPNKLESKNDIELGKYWASLGDIFINDAFGTSHRAHASNVGIASNLPNGIGFLIEKEIKYIKNIIDNPNRPFTVILGGSKVQDKIKVIENLVTKADYILIGGGMCYTFLKTKGYNIGKSLLDNENINFCNNILNKYPDKIILPIDNIVSDSLESNTCTIKDNNDIKDNDMGLDIGPKTIELFKTYINKSNTIIWNGPLGVFENEMYANGTNEILKSLVGKTTIIAGGDTASAAINAGYKDIFTHISTGGGASLEMMEGAILPAIDIIKKK